MRIDFTSGTPESLRRLANDYHGDTQKALNNAALRIELLLAERSGGTTTEIRRWNSAIDWLINSRYMADQDVQTMFWAIVDGDAPREGIESQDLTELRRLAYLRESPVTSEREETK